MADINATIDVDRPISMVYNQWTQFEEFPRFMGAVEEVKQLDDTTLNWRASIAGVEREWQARITEQIPDQVIAWTSTEGVKNSGRVSFEPLGEEATRVHLVLEVEPESLVDKIGEGIGLVESRAEDDLERFRDFIESLPYETGAWRGEVSSTSSGNESVGSQDRGAPLESTDDADPLT